MPPSSSASACGSAGGKASRGFGRRSGAPMGTTSPVSSWHFLSSALADRDASAAAGSLNNRRQN
eukprot:3682636-Pyramimonas_sp.AAC.1